ncbi:PREDICTED: growth/differentiation factor 15 [Myotis brandtii]|uniref:growth/differentiation factor 15 n=1 Tax=Myotis brandtii TaxID=109478 RepID=UPI000703F759|nr:PREDICTED: growth/differentiation factor 15 [Myotis brandtii]
MMSPFHRGRYYCVSEALPGPSFPRSTTRQLLPQESSHRPCPAVVPGVFTVSAGPGGRGRTKSGEYKGLAAASGQSQLRAQGAQLCPGRAPGHRAALMLLMLLTLSWLPSGGALSLAQEHLPVLPEPSHAHSSPNISRSQELRKRYEDLLTRLRANQTWEDSNPDLIPASHVQILTPKLRLGPGGHLHLGIPRANLTKGLPAASRLHRALLRLSPTESGSWDVTRPLQRQIGFGVSREPALPLHWLPPSDRLLAPEGVPAPCCVPASYEPVVLLHRDSEGRVSLTPYDDLVASDCHCL